MRSLLALALLGALAHPAGAVTPPDCSTLTNPIYLEVGDTQLNLMKSLGRALRDNSPKPITLVFVTNGSCTNIGDFYRQTGLTVNFQYIPSTAENPNWTISSATLACTPHDTTNGQPLDIANSALFIASCANEPTMPNFAQFTTGPIQGYVMAVPKASEAIAITFEEAYFLFGIGPTILHNLAADIMPWTDETQVEVRNNTKSTQLTWAANIDVPAGNWHGVANTGSPAVVTALSTTSSGAAIGILGAEVYDGARASLTELAFRAEGQYAAYYADSTSTSRDKKNVRDGHYTVWSPTVWMNKIDPTTMQPVNPDTQYIINLIAGKDVTPTPNFDPNVIIARVGLVPDCAMRVQRSFDGGPLSLYKPAESCTCKFESIVDASSCATCDTSNPCASGVCRAGYCEEF
jgi:hypothetical protein